VVMEERHSSLNPNIMNLPSECVLNLYSCYLNPVSVPMFETSSSSTCFPQFEVPIFQYSGITLKRADRLHAVWQNDVALSYLLLLFGSRVDIALF
jgi:hypothetical protein